MQDKPKIYQISVRKPTKTYQKAIDQAYKAFDRVTKGMLLMEKEIKDLRVINKEVI